MNPPRKRRECEGVSADDGFSFSVGIKASDHLIFHPYRSQGSEKLSHSPGGRATAGQEKARLASFLSSSRRSILDLLRILGLMIAEAIAVVKGSWLLTTVRICVKMA